MEQISIVLVWGVSALVIIAYVIYRIVTDKRVKNKRNILYPLTSYLGDPVIPKSKLMLLSYVFILVGISGVLLQLLNEIGITTIALPVLTFLQTCFLFGVILLIVVKVKSYLNQST